MFAYTPHARNWPGNRARHRFRKRWRNPWVASP
jgi:hypothetical protein